MVIDAKIEGPLRWLDDPSIYAHPLGQEKGVYIWTIDVGGRCLVHYVGMTEVNFAFRMKQHQHDYLSGMYFLFDPEGLRNGRLDEIWFGMATPGEEVRRPEFVRRCAELLAAADKTMRMIDLWFIPLPLEKKPIEWIEAAIARHVRDSGQHLIEPPVTYRGRPRSADPIQVTLSTSAVIVGVPLAFVA